MKPDELKLLIKEGEGLTVEFKERFTNKIDKDIVAFANSKGGHLILGVDDNGKIVGEKLINKLKAEITDLARKCDPNISIKKISQIDKTIVIEITESDKKPHSCSHGFYRRLDAITQKMTQKEIKILFKENDNQPSFEERIYADASLNDISKEKIKTFFKAANISVSDINIKNVLESLSLTKDSFIKNAGILFFAKDPRKMILQCQMTCAAFKGTNRIHIYDRIDIQDDLLTQFESAITFLKKHLNIRSEIKGVNRKDIYEISIEALREAVANAIIHRDYSIYGTSIMVEVHEDRVVISNPGGLLAGVDIPSIKNGISKRRNELIADIFARMDKAERIGSGLKRIGEIMKATKQPFPEIDSNYFFHITFKRPFYTKSISQASDKSLEVDVNMILEEIRKNPKISAKKLAEVFGVTSRAIEKHISNLKAAGSLERVGSKKHGHWKIK